MKGFLTWLKNLFSGNFKITSDGSLRDGEKSTIFPDGMSDATDFVNGLVTPADGKTSLFGALTNWLNAMSGEHMTNAEVERNEMQMQNQEDVYQRQVTGMQKAGLNPALMYGSGVATAPSAPSSSAPGMSMSDLMQFAMIKPQLSALRADVDVKKATKENIDADTKLKETNAGLNTQLFEFNKEINPLRVKAQELANNLSSAEERRIYKQIDEAEANIKKLLAEAKTEEERKDLVVAEKLLAEANAKQVTELLPYQIALTKANTALAGANSEAARASALNSKAQALLGALNSAYQSRLINDGYLDAVIQEAKAKARSAEDKAVIDDIAASIRNNTFVPNLTNGEPGFLGDLFGSLLGGVSIVLDNFNPLTGMLR